MQLSLDARPARNDVLDRFLAIDWSFPDSKPDSVLDVHPYPAKFVSEIPRAAIGLLEVEGAVVDPFCGCGTTQVEAVAAGRTSYGIDLNPIATLVSRAKLSGWLVGDEVLANAHRIGLVEAAQRGDRYIHERARTLIPRLDHWFDPVAQHALAGASGYIAALPADDRWRDLLSAAVSSIIVRVSRQESDTRYAAVDKNTSQESIAAAIERAVIRVTKAAQAVASRGVVDAATIITGDARTAMAEIPAQSCAAAIFSPPYPNAYEYWLYHKYRMYWLGFDPLGVKGAELGARPFYSGSGRLTGDDFAEQMSHVFRGVHRALVPEGLAFVVVGDSVIRGQLVDNGTLLARTAREAGFHLVGRCVRSIRRTSRSFNLKVSRAQSEHVLLLEPV